MNKYKCKNCSHEVILSVSPYECDICGHHGFITINQEIALSGGKNMAIDIDLFSSSKFLSTIQNYCRQIGWKILDINDKRAVLIFTMDSGVDQTLYIIRYDNTLEFSCPSGVKFDNTDDVPHRLSTFLLTQNAKFKIGFWCLEEISGRQVFSIMHNAEISLIDVNYFKKVILKLITECDEFEQAIAQMLR